MKVSSFLFPIALLASLAVGAQGALAASESEQTAIGHVLIEPEYPVIVKGVTANVPYYLPYQNGYSYDVIKQSGDWAFHPRAGWVTCLIPGGTANAYVYDQWNYIIYQFELHCN